MKVNLGMTLTENVYVHKIVRFLLFSKKDSIPTKQLTQQIKMDIPLIFSFTCSPSYSD